MVNKIEKDGKFYYKCEECDFKYKEKRWAEKCEKWCGEKHSCNLEITKHTIK